MPGILIHNGKFLQDDEPVFMADNRSFRYGDGLFETIRLHDQRMPLWDLHQQRLFHGLDKLGFQLPKLITPHSLLQQILELTKKNRLSYARVRVSFYRGNGGLTDQTDETAGYIIQTWPIPQEPLSLNTNGLRIGIFEEAVKANDSFSSIKSNNFLPYALGAQYARKQKWNDALLLNPAGKLTDSTIANLFWIKAGQIFTPPLADGPIAGVMRRFIAENISVEEASITPAELYQADEVFLTNAVRGLQWVSFIDSHPMTSFLKSQRLFQQLIAPLFP